MNRKWARGVLMPQPVLRIENVSKSLKGKQIVRDIDLTLYPRDVFGFLGPNGPERRILRRLNI